MDITGQRYYPPAWHREISPYKVGVGAKPKGWDLADHVLGRFSTEDRKLVDEAIAKAAKAVDIIITQGTDAAMNDITEKYLYRNKQTGNR